MSATDPLATWWEALERGGYGPHGQPHSFRSRDPLCGSNNPKALHVFVGADGRAVPHCFVCKGHPKDIAIAAGINPADSFPAGHHNARRYQLGEARRSDFTGQARTVANLLLGLQECNRPWSLELRTDCVVCGTPHALIVVNDLGAFLSCPCDLAADALGYVACTLRQFQQVLAGRLHDRREEA